MLQHFFCALCVLALLACLHFVAAAAVANRPLLKMQQNRSLASSVKGVKGLIDVFGSTLPKTAVVGNDLLRIEGDVKNSVKNAVESWSTISSNFLKMTLDEENLKTIEGNVLASKAFRRHILKYLEASQHNELALKVMAGALDTHYGTKMLATHLIEVEYNNNYFSPNIVPHLKNAIFFHWKQTNSVENFRLKLNFNTEKANGVLDHRLWWLFIEFEAPHISADTRTMLHQYQHLQTTELLVKGLLMAEPNPDIATYPQKMLLKVLTDWEDNNPKSLQDAHAFFMSATNDPTSVSFAWLLKYARLKEMPILSGKPMRVLSLIDDIHLEEAFKYAKTANIQKIVGKKMAYVWNLKGLSLFQVKSILDRLTKNQALSDVKVTVLLAFVSYSQQRNAAKKLYTQLQRWFGRKEVLRLFFDDTLGFDMSLKELFRKLEELQVADWEKFILKDIVNDFQLQDAGETIFETSKLLVLLKLAIRKMRENEDEVMASQTLCVLLKENLGAQYDSALLLANANTISSISVLNPAVKEWLHFFQQLDEGKLSEDLASKMSDKYVSLLETLKKLKQEPILHRSF
ncbi:hypothetical protein CCR75_007321 [Bremia lactucae]|uniref:Secreted RxLR effector n=1 Tax=Bremia lactucae TaxID=4779 RepID=A0A976FHS8_BRELC|nr:hypothetical protein CCR75_007321 [Bremia lactucae]